MTYFSCLQIARAFGASDIIAVDVQDEKLQKAKAFGATHTVNAIQEDAIEKIRVRILYFYLSFWWDITVRAQVFLFLVLISTFKMEAVSSNFLPYGLLFKHKKQKLTVFIWKLWTRCLLSSSLALNRKLLGDWVWILLWKPWENHRPFFSVSIVWEMEEKL